MRGRRRLVLLVRRVGVERGRGGVGLHAGGPGHGSLHRRHGSGVVALLLEEGRPGETAVVVVVGMMVNGVVLWMVAVVGWSVWVVRRELHEAAVTSRGVMLVVAGIARIRRRR